MGNKYTVQWRYSSSLGQFAQGDVVELDDELAAAINRDSPGVLARIVEGPPADRMIKRARKRAGG